MIKKNTMKAKLMAGKKVLGTYVKSTDPAMIEVLCLSGLDCILLDNEHTAMSKETMASLLRTSELYDVTGIVRVRQNDASMILQALDAGAYGVQVPNLTSAEEVKQVVQRMYYTPKGSRGFANTTRTAGYGLMPVNEYIQKANDELLCICYCETKAAYDHLDEILAVEGLDMVFIGPSDLSQAFGVLGDTNNPKVLDAIQDIIERTKKAGLFVGTVASNPDRARELFEKGADLIVLSSDQGFMAQSAKQGVSALKDLLE